MRVLAVLTLVSIVVTTACSFVPPSCQSVLPRQQTLLRASPLDFFTKSKIGLVKSIAGDYDENAIKSKLDTLIKKKPLLMLSFTTWPYCIKGEQMYHVSCAICNKYVAVLVCNSLYFIISLSTKISFLSSIHYHIKAKKLLDEKNAKYTGKMQSNYHSLCKCICMTIVNIHLTILLQLLSLTRRKMVKPFGQSWGTLLEGEKSWMNAYEMLMYILYADCVCVYHISCILPRYTWFLWTRSTLYSVAGRQCLLFG